MEGKAPPAFAGRAWRRRLARAVLVFIRIADGISTMDRLERDLLECMQGLGSFDEEGVFQATQETRGCLSDIEYMIKRDNPETRNVYIILGKWEVVEKVLIPLAVAYREDKIFFYTIRLLTRLTMPLPEGTAQVAKQLEHLQQYKAAFLDSDMLPVMVSWIQESLVKADSERTKDDLDRLELFLTICLNLLKVPDPTASRAGSVSDDWTHLHDRAVLAFHKEAILDVFVVIGTTMGGSKYALLMLDIFYHLFEREDPASLVSSASTKERLADIKRKEVAEKRKRGRSLSSRHSRFGSRFAIRHSLNKGSTQIVTNIFDDKRAAVLNKSARTFSRSGGRGRKLQLDRPARDYLNGQVPKVLASCLDQILESCFAPIVRTAQEEVMEKMQSVNVFPEDTRNYMTFTAMCLAYHRLRLQRRRREHERVFGKIKRRGEKTVQEGRKEQAPVRDGESKPNEAGSGVAVPADGNAPAVENRSASDAKATPAADEQSPDNDNGRSEGDAKQELGARKEPAVEEAVSSTQKPGAADAKTAEPADNVKEQDNRDESIYPGMFTEDGPLSLILDEHIFTWITSTVGETLDLKPIDWAKLTPAMHMLVEMVRNLHDMVAHGNRKIRRQGFRVQRNLFYQDTLLTMLMRLVREYRPNRNPRSYLANLVTSVYFVLRMLAKIDDSHAHEFLMRTKVRKVTRGEGNEAKVEFVEREYTFEMAKFVGSLAHPVIISNYFLLLSTFEINSEETNDCILRFFQKLALDLKAVPVFFQLSYFEIFEAILDSKTKRKSVRKLQEFAKFIVSRFAKIARKNKIVFMELCFFKGLNVCESIYHPEKEVHSMADKARASRERERRRRERMAAEIEALGRNADAEEDEMDDDGIEKLAERARKMKEGTLDDEDADMKATHRWTKTEDDLLRANYEDFKHLGRDGFDILAGMLPGRDATQVSRRLRTLKLLVSKARGRRDEDASESESPDTDVVESDGSGREEELGDEPEVSEGEQLAAFAALARAQAASGGQPRSALEMLRRKLQRCADVRGEFGRVMDFPVIPIDDTEWALLMLDGTQAALKCLSFREPDLEASRLYWRIQKQSSIEWLKSATSAIDQALSPNQPEKQQGNIPLDEKSDEQLQTDQDLTLKDRVDNLMDKSTEDAGISDENDSPVKQSAVAVPHRGSPKRAAPMSADDGPPTKRHRPSQHMTPMEISAERGAAVASVSAGAMDFVADAIGL